MDELRAELTRARHGALACLLILITVVGGAACHAAPPAAVWDGLFDTKEAAAQAVADALAAQDVAKLRKLTVSGVEFRKNMWPHLPASNPDVGMPVEYVWSDTDVKSRNGLAQTVASHGGEPLTVATVLFSESVDHGPFRVHKESTVRARTPQGSVMDVRLFGSMIETPAGWKVFSYIVD